jgi:Domain of unknown function (DUF6794)
MKQIIHVLLFLGCMSLFGQKLELCHPEYVQKISNQIIEELDREELKTIKNRKLKIEQNWLNENERILNNRVIINYSDFLPILEYKGNLGKKYLSENQLERVFLTYTLYKIQNENKCISEVVDKFLEESIASKKEVEQRIKMDTIDGVYIPLDLNDALIHLDLKLTENLKAQIKTMTEESFIAESHFGIGLTIIRNGWELWAESRLSHYFNGLGINHPDTMSGIILTSYYRKLTGKPIDLSGQLKEHKNYLIKNPYFFKKDFPSFVKDVELEKSISYPEFKGQEEWPSLNIYKSLNGKITWIYEYKCGWKELNKKQTIELEKKNDYEISNWLEKICQSE